MTTRPERAQKLSDGLVVACYGCGRAGVVQGPEICWDQDPTPKLGSAVAPILCPACWIAPKLG